MNEFSSYLRVAHAPASPAPLNGAVVESSEGSEVSVRSRGRAQEGLGPVTVEGYIKMLRKFVLDTGEIYPRRQTIVDALMSLHNRRMSFSHVRNFRVAAEWYMKFWNDPIQLLKVKKPERVIREFLTEGDVRKLLNVCRNLREQAIVSTLAYSGVRAKELCRLTLSDVNFESRSILVREGKGLKDRIVCISARCVEILRRYAEEENKTAADALFSRGPGVLRRTLKRIAMRCELPKRIHPHIFRHSLATNLLLRGCDLLTIQYQLGHSNIKTTISYIQFTPEIHRQKYDSFCPRYLEGEDDEKPPEIAVAVVVAPAGLLKRQRQAMACLGSLGRITNRIYMKLVHVARKTAYLDLNDLCARGILHREGHGRSSFYTAAHAVPCPVPGVGA